MDPLALTPLRGHLTTGSRPRRLRRMGSRPLEDWRSHCARPRTLRPTVTWLPSPGDRSCGISLPSGRSATPINLSVW